MTEADGSLYNEDFYAWTQQQAELLRRGPAAANRLDYDLIAEEIEYSGLDQPVRHWRREIAEWRLQLSTTVEFAGRVGCHCGAASSDRSWRRLDADVATMTRPGRARSSGGRAVASG